MQCLHAPGAIQTFLGKGEVAVQFENVLIGRGCGSPLLAPLLGCRPVFERNDIVEPHPLLDLQ